MKSAKMKGQLSLMDMIKPEPDHWIIPKPGFYMAAEKDGNLLAVYPAKEKDHYYMYAGTSETNAKWNDRPFHKKYAQSISDIMNAHEVKMEDWVLLPCEPYLKHPMMPWF